MISYANLIFIQLLTTLIYILWILDGVVFPFKKVSKSLGLMVTVLVILCEVMLYMKGSAYVAKIYPHWIIGKMTMVGGAAFLKLALKPKWTYHNKLWSITMMIIMIMAFYLQAYKPLKLL